MVTRSSQKSIVAEPEEEEEAMEIDEDDLKDAISCLS